MCCLGLPKNLGGLMYTQPPFGADEISGLLASHGSLSSVAIHDEADGLKLCE